MARELFVVGVSWRTAPVSVREKLAFQNDDIPRALSQLLESPVIEEGLIVSTCNRVEIYGATPSASGAALVAATAEARRFLSGDGALSSETLAEGLYEHTETHAVRHLFRVASALDSMVVGESQILGQVKDAYGAALRANTAGPLLNKCMQQAFTVAKRVRSETGISRGAANVSSVAVELASRVFGDLHGRSVLVVGAGKMSVLAARHLHGGGATPIIVTNRSRERAEALAAEIDGVARPWEQLTELIAGADVVISSTGASQPVLTRAIVKRALKARRYAPIVIVDIAVPRDADPAIAKLDGVYLFDIDDLEKIVAENLKERQKEADAAESIVAVEVTAFASWQRSQKVVPTIRSLRKHFAGVAAQEAEKVINSLRDDHTPEEHARAIRRLVELIVNKLLHTPMSALKSGEDLEQLVQVTHRLFDLPEGGDAVVADDTEPAAAADGGPVADGSAGTRRGSA
jgi:glutamyl-tRNA reductase